MTRFRDKAYVVGVRHFLSMAHDNEYQSNLIRCLYRRCLNNYNHPISTAKEYILTRSIDQINIQWIFHGETDDFATCTNNNNDQHIYDGEYADDMEARLHNVHFGRFIDTTPIEIEVDGGPLPIPSEQLVFEQLLQDSRHLLCLGSKHFSKLPFTLRMLYIKSICSQIVKSFDLILESLQDAFPHALLDISYQASRSLEHSHGFSFR